MLRAVLLLCLTFHLILADQCSDCVNNKRMWCPATSICSSTNATCDVSISVLLNCPRFPNASYAYDDAFARNVVNPLTAAAHSWNPALCLKNRLPSYTFNRLVSANCSVLGPNTTCHGYTAFDTVSRRIVASFAGAHGKAQKDDLMLSLLRKKTPFYQNGHILKYFHDAFFHLWNGGLETDIRQLKYLYPDYTILIVGHSLGATIATTMAAYMVQFGLWSGPQIQLLTMGQPRVGDYEFAEWHDATFPYSYRVVHDQDPVPNSPPSFGPDALFHRCPVPSQIRSLVSPMYQNNMTLGSTYSICPEADGPYCSATVSNSSEGMEHLIYFGKNVPVWGDAGCDPA